MNNYRHITLLLKSGKICKRILYNSLLNFLNQSNLIYPAQSDFKPGDSFINQLLLITHEIHRSMDEYYETCRVFLIYWKF